MLLRSLNCVIFLGMVIGSTILTGVAGSNSKQKPPVSHIVTRADNWYVQ